MYKETIQKYRKNSDAIFLGMLKRNASWPEKKLKPDLAQPTPGFQNPRHLSKMLILLAHALV
jgi:hypothetical protein